MFGESLRFEFDYLKIFRVLVRLGFEQIKSWEFGFDQIKIWEFVFGSGSTNFKLWVRVRVRFDFKVRLRVRFGFGKSSNPGYKCVGCFCKKNEIPTKPYIKLKREQYCWDRLTNEKKHNLYITSQKILVSLLKSVESSL